MLKVDGPAPYAPVKTLMTVIDRHRQVRLQTIDLGQLARIGVTDSLAPRTLQALKLLGLVDEGGTPTAEFEALRLAPSDIFQSKLADVVRDAYAPVFGSVDPTTDTVERIEDAFRGFIPAGQRGRMVTLFTGLLANAGLRADTAKKKTGPKPKPSYPGAASPGPFKGKPAPVVVVPALENSPVVNSSDDEGDTYQIPLKSGGSVSVSMDVNLFRLSVADRDFVMDLVDRLTSYAKTEEAKV